MTDPYLYPGINILRNKEGIRNKAELERFERLMTAERLSQPLPKVAISYDGYKSLHHHIFQDVYEWAGQSRTVDLAKGGTYFGPPRYVDQQMEERFALINQERDLRSLDADRFADRAALHLSEINAIHPFREGNGRTQRLFLEALAARAGHEIAIDRISPKQWLDASIAGFEGDYDVMRRLIHGAIL